MMCSSRLALITSISDASVVDLPEPVGPVTSTKPRGLLANSATTGGSPSVSSGTTSNGISRNAAPTADRWK
jgi:hypothetical protein